MLQNLFLPNGAQVLPHVVRLVQLHLLPDGLAQQVPRLELIGEALPLFIRENGPLSPHRFGDEETPAGLLGIQGGGVDLDVVQMLHRDLMAQGDGQSIPGDVGEVGGVLIQSSQATAGQHHVIGFDEVGFPLLPTHDHPAADIVLGHQVQHGGVFQDGDVGPGPDLLQQGGDDLLPGDVLMEQDAGAGVGPLPGVVQGAVGTAGKAHPQAQQVAGHLVGAADHQLHRVGVVFIVPGPEGILKIVRVILLPPQHAHAALGQIGVGFLRFLFCDDANIQLFCQM